MIPKHFSGGPWYEGVWRRLTPSLRCRHRARALRPWH